MNKLIFSLLALSSLSAVQATEYIKLTESPQDQELIVAMGDEFKVSQDYFTETSGWELIDYLPLALIDNKHIQSSICMNPDGFFSGINQQVWTFKAKEAGHFKLMFKQVCPSQPNSEVFKSIKVDVRACHRITIGGLYE